MHNQLRIINQFIMKKIILFLLLICLPKIMAQQAIVTAGGNVTGSNGKVSYSIGQVAYSNSIGSNGSINQGVQQPFEIFILGTDDFPEISLTMSVFPNPTTSSVNLSIQNYNSESMTYQLFDINSRSIQSQKITQTETQISLENLESAIYLLQISDSSKLLKTFKIIKN